MCGILVRKLRFHSIDLDRHFPIELRCHAFILPNPPVEVNPLNFKGLEECLRAFARVEFLSSRFCGPVFRSSPATESPMPMGSSLVESTVWDSQTTLRTLVSLLSASSPVTLVDICDLEILDDADRKRPPTLSKVETA